MTKGTNGARKHGAIHMDQGTRPGTGTLSDAMINLLESIYYSEVTSAADSGIRILYGLV